MKMSVMHYCLWLQLVTCAVGSRVSIEPSVQTVVIGQNATLVCSTLINQYVDWRFKKTGVFDPESEITYDGMLFGIYESKYITYTDDAAGNHGLIIANAQINDSGTYYCVDDKGFGEIAYAEVNVVDIAISVTPNRDTPWPYELTTTSPRPELQLSTYVSTREPLLSDPETEVGTATITLIIAVTALVILIIILVVVMLSHIFLSKEEKTCCCYSQIDNPTTTEESLMKKSDNHGKVSVVVEN